MKLRFLALALFVLLGGLHPATAAPDRPNFVFFIADDVGWEDLGCYGHPTISTPAIDGLAANGMRFTNAYLTTSSCSPSRCSIITGRYPHNTGAPELHTRLPDDQIRFPEILREHGYYTALSGKNHMFGNEDRAFTKISRGKGPGKEGDWVELVKDRPRDQHFFFWFASTDAHRSWQVSEDIRQYAPDEVVVPPYLVDGPGTRQDLALYYHEVSRFDHYVGQVIAELEAQGVLEHTVIVVMADNGRPFPRCKTRLYDSGIRTPFVVHYPALVKEAAVTDSLISAVDISATFLDLAELPKPDTVHGISFASILHRPESTVREVAFAEHNWHVHKNHERMLRFGDWLYIRNNYPNQPNLCNEAYNDPAGEELWQAQAAGRTTPAQQNIFRNPCPPEELYRVGKDPHQLDNLAANPENGPVLEQARGLLEQWTEQTGDTVPDNPTLDRDLPPRIEDGEIIPGKRKYHPDWSHREMPGAAANATEINHPGPVRLRD